MKYNKQKCIKTYSIQAMLREKSIDISLSEDRVGFLNLQRSETQLKLA